MRFKRLSILFVSLLFTACTARTGSNLIIATATTGGTYYPVGVAIGTLISSKLNPAITASAINSAGSGENLQMLANKEAHLAILQGFFGAIAYEGREQYKNAPIKDFRAITMLWQNVEHFALKKSDARTGNILDLKTLGQKFSIGKRGSGTEGSTLAILGALGVDAETDLIPEYLGYDASAQAMMDNRIAGGSFPAGPPVAAITQLYAQLGADHVVLLEFTDEQIARLGQAYKIWSRYVIKPGVYPGQTEAVRTIAQSNFLACRADLPEDVIYQITRTLYENLPYLRKIHKATLAMSLEKAIEGLPVPLHPGAEKYYRERGLTIPESLSATAL